MDTPSLKIHMQIIRRINCEIRSINRSRINCIIQAGMDDIIISSKNGNVYTIMLGCDVNSCDIGYIINLYTNMLKKINSYHDMGCNVTKIHKSLLDSIYLQGLNPMGNIGRIKRNKAKTLGFQINYEVSIDSIFTAAIRVYNSDSDIIKNLPCFSTKCGAVIDNIIKTYIGATEWSSDSIIKIYKPSKSLLCEVDLAPKSLKKTKPQLIHDI